MGSCLRRHLIQKYYLLETFRCIQVLAAFFGERINLGALQGLLYYERICWHMSNGLLPAPATTPISCTG
ncbi:hypothetical protein CBM2621_B130007 [Cupriavidus taiwanensis]|nr:hypothetical protein CBM2621_B130007 [Cupriavidus taiwanensis]